MFLEGSRLGRYQLLRQVSSGGMGTIFLAQDTHMPRQVAVKVVRIDNDLLSNDPNAPNIERTFYREIEAISQLDHPHILPVFDFGREKIDENTYIYLVMPFRPEGSLAEWLRRHQSNERLSLSETATLLSQAAEALQHAHEHGIVHQDVKPSNFLLRTRSTQPEALPDLLLMDFGIAQFLSSASSQSHAVRGTPLFMAPEQWDGKPIPASDQYALAIMAFRLLTGQFPFQGGPMQIMRQHYITQPLTPSTLNPQLNLAIDMVIMRALAKQASDRFPSILDFAQALSHAQQSPGDLQSILANSLLAKPQGEEQKVEASETLERGQSEGAPQILETSAEVPGQVLPAKLPSSLPSTQQAANPLSARLSGQTEATERSSDVPMRFKPPFYTEDTPMDVKPSVKIVTPVSPEQGPGLDQPPPFRRTLPRLYRILLASLVALLILGSGGVLFFKNSSLNIFASGLGSLQTATISQNGQVQGVQAGTSTPQAGQTGTQVALPGADPGTGGKKTVTPGAKSTPSTAPATPTRPGAAPTSAPHPTPVPTPKPAPTPKPVSTLPAPPGGGALSSTSFPTGKWWVSTFGSAPGYRGGWQQVGILYGNTNYVFCKALGASVSDSSGNYNHWWMWTDLDTGGQGWVSAYYLSKWGNDVAKDNSGNVLPDC